MSAPIERPRSRNAYWRRLHCAELYAHGLTVLEMAQRVGVSPRTVYEDLQQLGISRRNRHLRIVPPPPEPPRPPRQVAPERAALAFTADRGWHMVQAPPGWLLDVLAEVD